MPPPSPAVQNIGSKLDSSIQNSELFQQKIDIFANFGLFLRLKYNTEAIERLFWH